MGSTGSGEPKPAGSQAAGQVAHAGVVQPPEPVRGDGPLIGELIGYADRLSAGPGDRIRFMVSTDLPSYEVSFRRLIHGDARPNGAGPKTELVTSMPRFTCSGRVQPTATGSYVLVPPAPALSVTSLTLQAWVYPTAPRRGTLQGLLGRWSERAGCGYRLVIEADGDLALHLGAQGHTTVVARAGIPLQARYWYFVAATYDAETGRITLRQAPLSAAVLETGAYTELSTAARPRVTGDSPFLIGAAALRPGPGRRGTPVATYDGKIDSPRLFNVALRDEQLGDLRADRPPDHVTDGALVAAWAFDSEPSSTRVADTGPHRLEGTAVNMPARAVTSHTWTGRELDHTRAPEQYAAIHFHSDDLEDAGWAPSFETHLPGDLASGVYAAHLRADGAVDNIPFVVRPRTGRPTAETVVLMPTMTYLAYANERAAQWVEQAGLATGLTFDPRDDLLARHPEYGLSTYDVHADGSGVCHSSFLRPIPNMRPDYRWWNTGGLAHFPADLYLIDWLEHEGFGYDVITDHDLHNNGSDLIKPYSVLLTATHPEYWTASMLDAAEGYLSGGGRVMYLGGNGFYTVTGVHPEWPHVIEVRRTNGTRTWASAPGEGYLSTTGEPGGQWRYRGRAPNRLVGVGFTAQDNSLSPAAGYERLEESYDERVSFIFDGVGKDEIIGDFGLMNGGAGGYEIDRLDHDLGTPPSTLLLASTAGRHNDGYLLAVDEFLTTQPGLTGRANPKVRADMVYVPGPHGGAVFSVGSINWCGSLSHNDYSNNVSAITGNVLRTFLSDGPGSGELADEDGGTRR